MKEENQVVAIDKEDAQFTFEVNEAFKVDGNNEKFFKNYRYKKTSLNFFIRN